MKVNKIMKWIIAIAAIALLVYLLVFAVRLIRVYPVYPGFLREVDSYHKLQETFAEESAVIFPEEPTGKVTDTAYHIFLDGRTISSEKIGYGAHYVIQDQNVRVAGFCNCRKEEVNNWTSDVHYRDISYQLIQEESEDRVDEPRNHCYLNFYLEDYSYTLGYTLYIKGLTEEEVAEKEENLKEELLQTMREIIDKYLDESGEHY